MPRRWRRIQTPILGADCWQTDVADGYLTVIVARESPGWHMSISHKQGDRAGRYPSWDEIVDARYRFCPDDVTMAQLLPPRAEFVNIHPTTFHLWQMS